MKHRNRRGASSHGHPPCSQSFVPVSAAVFLALYGIPYAARADQPPAVPTSGLEEIIVTATCREETTEQVPYAISVVGPDEIARNGVVDLASLGRETGVAGGTSASSAAISFPIIRGLNASPSSFGSRTIEQQPVGTYIDNSLMDGYFELNDIQRIEILRGPQGTLYGAGSLGGALRVIPNAPELGKFSGDIDGRLGDLDHARTPEYTATGMINIPIGESLALRAAGN